MGLVALINPVPGLSNGTGGSSMGKTEVKRVFHAGNRETDGPEGETLRHLPGRVYEAEYPPSTRESYRRAMEGRSRRAAIRAFSLMYKKHLPGHVRECTAPLRPLLHLPNRGWPLRRNLTRGGHFS